MSRAPVAVAVVSWNTRELLGRCLESLWPEVETGRAEVWVVDNGSSDGSPALVGDLAPWAKLLEPGENLGFGRAVNQVARRTDSEWLAAANADTALEPGALERLLAAGGDARAGIAAPRLVLPSGATQHSVHPFPTLSFSLLFNLGLHRVVPGLGERLCLEGYWDPDRPRAVDWAIGALLLIRRAAFERVGGFDERQWMYAEDLELAWRVAEAGWQTHFVPAARVRHEGGAATSAAFGPAKTQRFMAATYAVLARRRGIVPTWATAAVNCAGAAARLAWTAPLAASSERRRTGARASRVWLAAHRQGLQRPRRLKEAS